MESHQSLWNQCLALIRKKVDRHVYDVWFKDVVCERYDEQRKTVVLCVPSRYVVEYIEEIHLPLMKWALSSCFGNNVSLKYRLAENKPSATVNFQRAESGPYQNRVHITITNARERLETELHRFLGDKAQWLPAYDRVAEWLNDNKGRGLLLVGTTGLGKTIICERILPAIFGQNVLSVKATDMRAKLDGLLKERVVIIDGLGREPAKHYGNPDDSFFQLCDAAEQNGNLLIITTNLSTTPVNDPRYPLSIQERYGNEVISRLRSIVRAIEFKGTDMRN
jgi:DNA replication protein DnaC